VSQFFNETSHQKDEKVSVFNKRAGLCLLNHMNEKGDLTLDHHQIK
jgi:hypothetical protein